MVQTSSEVHPSHRKQVVYFISQQPSLPSPKVAKRKPSPFHQFVHQHTDLHHPSPIYIGIPWFCKAKRCIKSLKWVTCCTVRKPLSKKSPRFSRIHHLSWSNSLEYWANLMPETYMQDIEFFVAGWRSAKPNQKVLAQGTKQKDDNSSPIPHRINDCDTLQFSLVGPVYVFWLILHHGQYRYRVCWDVRYLKQSKCLYTVLARCRCHGWLTQLLNAPPKAAN